jgi:hypothetical protein
MIRYGIGLALLAFAASARRSKPDADEPRRSTSRRSGGDCGGNFDGAWLVVSLGTTCSGSSTTAVVVSSGKIIGEGLTGTVNPSGFASLVGNYNGITVISSGRVSGHNGSGTFKRSDGCVGRWTPSNQQHHFLFRNSTDAAHCSPK